MYDDYDMVANFPDVFSVDEPSVTITFPASVYLQRQDLVSGNGSYTFEATISADPST